MFCIPQDKSVGQICCLPQTKSTGRSPHKSLYWQLAVMHQSLYLSFNYSRSGPPGGPSKSIIESFSYTKGGPFTSLIVRSREHTMVWSTNPIQLLICQRSRSAVWIRLIHRLYIHSSQLAENHSVGDWGHPSSTNRPNLGLKIGKIWKDLFSTFWSQTQKTQLNIWGRFCNGKVVIGTGIVELSSVRDGLRQQKSGDAVISSFFRCRRRWYSQLS